METQYLIYAGLGCLLFIVILLLLLACHHRTNKYELERKPSESLFSTKRGINTSGLFGVESNNKDSEELSDKDIQIIDGDNIIEFEKSLENYRDIENDPDKAFIANLCERMEYDLKEKIKHGHCVCFKVPLRTKVIRDHGPSIENSDELSLKVDDVVLLTKIFDDGWAFGSRAKGRLREGAFPICCLENRYDLFRLLPKRENYDNFFNIDRYSSIRLCKNNLYQYYYHPVISSMKSYNNNSSKSKATILDIAPLEKENDISNYGFDILNETNNRKGINNNFSAINSERTIRLPDLSKRPLSYEEKVLSLKRSLERRQRSMRDSNKTINESDNNVNVNNNSSNDNDHSNQKSQN
ncbi:hypothetical protein LY90DRAFT_673363 [Neocallimastix californiae]|jgi:hypothetical protein|uniref:SH3 domain-containing protein n=1 Tax=Neocallimastix californiae TaxID=1754190 RepID=A0A1Y2BFS4_9FUNG|nr:hypothetical protein LY90DRAFT_673363 [Neocallimastix californiae]|eukprot:ORY33659.1 hypothetical protein LY90DRAFT_673363 [Neocallimastix californiae]